jgi:hypothetical protein
MSSHIAFTPIILDKVKAQTQCTPFGLQTLQLQMQAAPWTGPCFMELKASFSFDICTWCRQQHELNLQSRFTYHGRNFSKDLKPTSIVGFDSLKRV